MSALGLEFDLGEMADTIRDSTQRFATDKIAPIAAAIDREDRFPIELWPQMGELGKRSSRSIAAAIGAILSVAKRCVLSRMVSAISPRSNSSPSADMNDSLLWPTG